MPSIPRVAAKLTDEKSSDVLNLIITGMPSILWMAY